MSKINDWEDVPTNEINDWEDIKEKPSQLESFGRGVLAGGSLGFADEISGGVEALWNAAKGDPRTFGEMYQQYRDESRANFKEAEEANPATYTTGQLGGAVATAAVPGLGGATIGKLAAQGALQGLGSSEAENLAGMTRDTAIGAGAGALAGSASKAIGSSTVGRGAKAIAGKAANAIEDLITSPLGNKAAEPNMGAISKLASKSVRAGEAIDKGINKIASSLAPKAGNETVDALTEIAVRRGGYTIPVAGKVLAATDATSAAMRNVPKLTQSALSAANDYAQKVAPSLEAMIPKLGKYAKTLQEAAARGGTSLAATNFILEQTDPEYRQLKRKAMGEDTDEKEEVK